MYSKFVVFVSLLSSLTLSIPANSSPDLIVNSIKEVEQNLGAKVGVSIYSVSDGYLWHYNGDSRFPLMSTFKPLACAKLLHDVETAKLSIDRSVKIEEQDLITWSPITEKLVGESFSLKQACTAALVMSDNTAANIVLDGISGPSELTLFMKELGDEVTRLDRIEPHLNEARSGDERDTTTPNAIVKSLGKLLYGEKLSSGSKEQLIEWMAGNKVSDSLLRSVLPEGWSIADRSGAGGFGSRGITAAIWSNEQQPLIVAIYLTQTEASFDERNKAIAKIGREIFASYN
ncbi:class A beta-lactamase [Acinetobacter sichuanensis]|uniref:Beta-lactamase n=2 Tax=Gammaproteobacteria TaxID=1236 RepID=A0A371YJC9_9GAMM|nr:MULTISPECIES: class A beta-lactamase [Gammaproteobacteria]AXH60562.1 class A beta-lactamase [Providencia huaxiensis]MDW2597459.1 class A beta-lactamase [Citrobacter braakii]RFC81573.1 class A beta-lactamase [Acinetobacter sichuanensis]UPS63002.1 class A beta-lactamase [Providencia rettgeri]UPS63566.1 class A beta-lactamase [Providencia rettgeri]